MSGLTNDGLVIETQAEIQAALEADHRSTIDPRIDVSASSPDGLRIAIVARALAVAWEALQAVYASIDPDSARGAALDRLCAITGTYREPATASRVTCQCTLAAGTYAAGTLVVSVSGFPQYRFASLEDVTSAGGSNDVLFASEDLGPIPGPAGQITVIAVPVSGFTAVTNASSAVLGSPIESDAALRVRRAEEVAAPGSASVNGIVARVLRDNPLVSVCECVENPTDATVDSIGPHAVEVVVFGPASPSSADDQGVAESIFRAKSAGIQTYGSTSKTVVDSQGVSHTVKLTRPSEQATDVAISLTYDAPTYAGDDAVKAAIAAISPLPPGLDVAWAACVVAAMGVAGVLRVTSIQLDALGTFADKPITVRQFATIAEGDVTVTSSAGSP